MRYFKTVVNEKVKRIDASDTQVSGIEITKEEYDTLKSEFDKLRRERFGNVDGENSVGTQG